ncbi:formate hydrogenlyase maturation protein HycH [Celerinatantimonas yamalensis]|uniref:Formate hydrogenlyase maturation protein HycH n=1 Tax=Celerinatantimonas yamalensis TaxID=559956 RepID=A0ABW9GCX5_9GAMM
MSETVTFFALRRKFIDEQDCPDAAQQLVYYGLAIGHHLGVIDCFEPAFSCAYSDYLNWLEVITDPETKAKLSGITRYGEIIIDVSHVVMLARGLAAMSADVAQRYLAWRDELMQLLELIQQEKAVHLVVRRLND